MQTATRHLIFLACLMPILLRAQSDSLRQQFRKPPAAYSILPFWSLNGTLDPAKMKWQVDQMLDKGIDGAFLHARAGLDESATPYFSDGFWRAMDTTIQYSARKGFHTCLYDEDKWPSGSAGGRTLKVNPEEFIKKGLVYRKMEVVGPQVINLNLQEKPLALFASRISENGNYYSSSQVNLTAQAGKTWNVPPGRWALISFEMQKDPGEQIDYLDSAAVATFIKITHEEYYRRYGKYFGNTIPGIFFDEIFANFSRMSDNIFWTDDFLQKFREIKGYDLAGLLPLIIYSEPGKSENVRCDYFDVVKELYIRAWFRQYAKWCDDHHIFATGHTAEKLLHYKREADYFSTMGQLQVPGTDNEEYRYGYPRLIDYYNHKQISSVARLFSRDRVMAETMGGGGYTIPMEEYRYGFSMLGVYGINMFIPHLFHYTTDSPETQADWPPSWFYQNPGWKYFRPLADYAKRISFMNSRGVARCDIAILYPLTDVWANGYPERVDDAFYKEIQETLLEKHIDFDIIDPGSLERATLDRQTLVAGTGRYRMIILPSVRTASRAVMEKLTAFAGSGGLVTGIRELPVMSNNGLKDNERVLSMTRDLFGFDPMVLKQEDYHKWDVEKREHFTAKKFPGGGEAFFTRFLGELPRIIQNRLEPDVEVFGPNDKFLKFNHRQFGDAHFYWLVNDRNQAETYHLSVREKGAVSLWDPETGEPIPFSNFRIHEGRTEVILSFKARQGLFLSLNPGQASTNRWLVERNDLKDTQLESRDGSARIQGWGVAGSEHTMVLLSGENRVEKKWKSPSSLVPIPLDGNWSVRLAPHALDEQWSPNPPGDTLALPVMKFRQERVKGQGIREGWNQPFCNETGWKQVKIYDREGDYPGISRYVSDWEASWIGNYDTSMHLPEFTGGDRIFRKEIMLKNNCRTAELAITADRKFELTINGFQAAKGDNPGEASRIPIGKYLRKGSNILVVRTSDTKGLLVQGVVQEAGGRETSLCTDESWEVSADSIRWQPAFRVADPPQGWWGNLSNPLQKTVFPCEVWYRQVLPPGSKELLKPEISGRSEIFLNGKPLTLDVNRNRTDISAMLKEGDNVLAIRVTATNPNDGIVRPLRVTCGKVSSPLKPWDTMGLGWYSGRMVYSREVDIPATYFSGETKLELDPGEVCHYAEIWVNGKLASVRPWPPYRCEIGSFLKPGKNTVTLVVANLLANQATWNILDANLTNKAARWWHYGSIEREKDKLRSGLMGPVSIIPMTLENVSVPASYSRDR